MKSVKQQYIDLKEGKMSQAQFMRNIRLTLPQYITNVISFNDSIKILKNKGIINEIYDLAQEKANSEYESPQDRMFNSDEWVKAQRDAIGMEDSLEAVKAEALRISKEEGVVQHVNSIDNDRYKISDWYDSDSTICSYENGRELNEGVPKNLSEATQFLDGHILGTAIAKAHPELLKLKLNGDTKLLQGAIFKYANQMMTAAGISKVTVGNLINGIADEDWPMELVSAVHSGLKHGDKLNELKPPVKKESTVKEHHDDPNFPKVGGIIDLLDAVAEDWGEQDLYNDLEDTITAHSIDGQLKEEGIKAIKDILTNWDVLEDYEYLVDKISKTARPLRPGVDLGKSFDKLKGDIMNEGATALQTEIKHEIEIILGEVDYLINLTVNVDFTTEKAEISGQHPDDPSPAYGWIVDDVKGFGIKIDTAAKDVDGEYQDITDPAEIEELHASLIADKIIMKRIEDDVLEKIELDMGDHDPDFNDEDESRWKMDETLIKSLKESTNQSSKEQYNHFKEIDNLNSQEVLIGIDCEMQHNHDLTKDQAAKIVIKKLKKNQFYYTDYALAGKEAAPMTMGKLKPGSDQMRPVKGEDSLVDKDNGMKSPKDIEKVKASSNKAKKETNTPTKGISLMSLIAQSSRGVQKMNATGEKMKKITIKESIDETDALSYAKYHAGSFEEFIIPRSVEFEGDQEHWWLEFNLEIPAGEANERELEDELEFNHRGGPGVAYSRSTVSISEKESTWIIHVSIRGGLDI